MIIDVKVPMLSESVSEGTLLEWKKKVGEAVARDEILIDIETDKVVLEVPSPQAGVLVEIIAQNGETVAAEQVLARIDTAATASASAEAPAAAPAPEAAPAAAQTNAAMPAAAKLAAETGVDVNALQGSGRDGRVLKEDVQNATAKPAAAPAVASVPAPVPAGARPEQRVPMSRLRARVAERLLASQQENAILTTFNEVNMKPIMDLRAKYKEKFEKEHGVKTRLHVFLRQSSRCRAEKISGWSMPPLTAATSFITVTSTSVSLSAARAVWSFRFCEMPTK